MPLPPTLFADRLRHDEVVVGEREACIGVGEQEVAAGGVAVAVVPDPAGSLS
jgi:hypothetical protein